MAKKKAPTVELTDEEKIALWRKKNKIKRIAPNVGGENVVKNFYIRRPKKKTKTKSA